MSSGVFKGTVIIVLLIALAFVVGSLAADGAKSAIAPIGIVCGLFGLLLLGKHCWVLVYVLPPLISLLELQIVRNLPVGYAIATVILFYWILMYVMGFVQMKWCSVPLLDAATLVWVVYFLLTWVWYPVVVNDLANQVTYEGDALVGGKEYIWCVFSIVCYVLISIIPVKLETILKLLKVVVLISLPLILLNTAKVYHGASVEADMGSEMVGSRFGYLKGMGAYILNLMLCKYGVLGILCSPWKFLLLAGAGLAVALSGFRSEMFKAALMTLFTQWYHKQLIIAFLPCVVAYGIIYYMASEQMLNDLPYGVKRVLTAIPGVKEIDRKAAVDARGSLLWRYQLWDWAMNPSTGFIKDYVWGDGFGVSLQMMKQNYVLEFRGAKNEKMSHQWFARMGVWHNGAIVAIHRTGYVGLGILIVWMLVVTWHILRICSAIYKVKGKEYAYFYILPLVVDYILFYISAGTFSWLFAKFFNVALVKLLYAKVIEEGYLKPMWQRKIYVPLMIRETEETPLAEKA